MFGLDEIQHYPVNWKNGMRVQATDFMATDRAWTDALRDIRATLFKGIEFGLLPALKDRNDTSAYPKLVYNSASSLLTLKECRAITEGGYRIEITEDLHNQYKVPLQLPSASIQQKEDFSVYITVDIFSPQGAGKISTDAPPRYQFVSPFYELSVIYKSDEIGLPGFNHLKIAEYIYSNDNYLLNKTFIPPCMTIHTHAQLLDRFLNAGASLRSLHDKGISLIKLYKHSKRPDVKDAMLWVEKVTLFIAQSIWFYNDSLQTTSPLHTITFFKNLGQYLLSTMDIYSDNKFLKDGINSQRKFFRDLADPNFNGNDLKTAFDRIDLTLRALQLWFKALEQSFTQGRIIKIEHIR